MKTLIYCLLTLALLGSAPVQAKPPKAPPAPDYSGVVTSDYPDEIRAWIKGWLPAAGKRRVAVVIGHSNPSAQPPNNRIYCVKPNGEREYRTIVQVERPNLLVGIPLIYQNLYSKGDVALVKVDKPFPKSCAVYDIGQVKLNSTNVTVRKPDGNPVRFTLAAVSPFYEWIGGGRNSPGRFRPGDSGTAWFSLQGNRWTVVSMTSLGMHGEGPNFGRPSVKIILENSIKSLLP